MDHGDECRGFICYRKVEKSKAQYKILQNGRVVFILKMSKLAEFTYLNFLLDSLSLSQLCAHEHHVCSSGMARITCVVHGEQGALKVHPVSWLVLAWH